MDTVRSQVKWYYPVVCVVDCHVDEDQGDILKETGGYTEYVNCDCPYRQSVPYSAPVKVTLALPVGLNGW